MTQSFVSRVTCLSEWRTYGTISRPGSARSPLVVSSVLVEPLLERRTIHIQDLASGGRDEFPEQTRSHRAPGFEHVLLRPCSEKGSPIGAIIIRRMEVRPFTDKHIELARNLRRPSGDRHRECAAVQRTPGAQRGIARSPGASDGDGRGARHHQPLADGCAAGPRRHRRERRPGLWDR